MLKKTVIIIVVFFLLGCSSYNIKEETISLAKQACEQNGGLDEIKVISDDIIITCKNGASFKYDFSENSFIRKNVKNN